MLPLLDDESEDAEAEEGRLLTALHRRRERDPKLARQKKEQALSRHGSLACEACGFDFAATYGDAGTASSSATSAARFQSCAIVSAFVSMTWRWCARTATA